MSRSAAGRLLRWSGRVLLAIGAAGAVLSTLAMLAALLFARSRLGDAFQAFVWSGTIICFAAAIHFAGRRTEGEKQ